jgi:hypothetical protein
MKLARCTDGGAPFWALVDVGHTTVTPIAGGFEDWAPRITRGEGECALQFSGPARLLSEVRLLPPIDKGNKVVIAGANYTKHLVEFGLKPPGQPFSFLKAYGALIGANDAIRYPPLTSDLDPSSVRTMSTSMIRWPACSVTRSATMSVRAICSAAARSASAWICMRPRAAMQPPAWARGS